MWRLSSADELTRLLIQNLTSFTITVSIPIVNNKWILDVPVRVYVYKYSKHYNEDNDDYNDDDVGNIPNINDPSYVYIDGDNDDLLRTKNLDQRRTKH